MSYFCSKRSECTFHLLIWVSARKFSFSALSWQEIVQIRILGYNLVSLMLDPFSEWQAEVRSDLDRTSSSLTTSPRAHLWRSPDGTWYLFCIRSPLGLMWMTLCLQRWSFQLLPWAPRKFLLATAWAHPPASPHGLLWVIPCYHNLNDRLGREHPWTVLIGVLLPLSLTGENSV